MKQIERICSLCLANKNLEHDFYKKNRSKDGRDNVCKDCRKESEKIRGIQLKTLVVNAYGGKCICCGESEIHFLSIDHINSDGSAHRKSLGITAGRPFYRWLRDNGYPSGHQVLCYNCNCAKEYNGICPHQEERESFERYYVY